MNGIFINETNKPENALLSTAFDDYSLRTLPENTMILHTFWHSGINMGFDDTKIPDFDKGLDYYKKNNIPVILRSSGGRSIVSDEGVLNMSLVLRGNYSMYEAYDYYEVLIKEALSPFDTLIQSGEIKGAYCPGDSDLSIDGKKFCGTAQRRRKDVILLVCYISVNGDQFKRGQLVKEFYNSMNHHDIVIDPSKMESLEKLTGYPFTLENVTDRLYHVFKNRTDSVEIIDGYNTNTDQFQTSYAMTCSRNKKVF